jgi:hypothetical protein
MRMQMMSEISHDAHLQVIKMASRSSMQRTAPLIQRQRMRSA